MPTGRWLSAWGLLVAAGSAVGSAAETSERSVPTTGPTASADEIAVEDSAVRTPRPVVPSRWAIVVGATLPLDAAPSLDLISLWGDQAEFAWPLLPPEARLVAAPTLHVQLERRLLEWLWLALGIEGGYHRQEGREPYWGPPILTLIPIEHRSRLDRATAGLSLGARWVLNPGDRLELSAHLTGQGRYGYTRIEGLPTAGDYMTAITPVGDLHQVEGALLAGVGAQTTLHEWVVLRIGLDLLGIRGGYGVGGGAAGQRGERWTLEGGLAARPGLSLLLRF